MRIIRTLAPALAALVLSFPARGLAWDGQCPERAQPALAGLGEVVERAAAVSGDKAKKSLPEEPELSDDDRAEILRGKSVNVPGHVQEGPTCGIYALKMVMDQYHRKDPRHWNPPAQEGKPGDGEPIYGYAKRTGNLWREDGATTHWGLKAIAKAYGYQNTTLSNGVITAPTIQDLKDALAQGIPPMCSVAKHWVVVEGFSTREGVEYVILKHGHREEDYVWTVKDFETRWSAMWHAVVYVKP